MKHSHLGKLGAALGVVLAACILLAVQAQPFSSQPAGDPDVAGGVTGKVVSPVVDNLLTAIDHQGTVRVIVGMDSGKEGLPRMPMHADATARQRRRQDVVRLQERILSRLDRRNIGRIQRFKFIPYIALEVNAVALDQMLQMAEVSSVQPDHLVEITLADSVPIIGADTAFDWGYTGNGQVVAVLDTGVAKNHSFLSGKVVAEACFSSTTSGTTTLCPNGTEEQIGDGAGAPCSGISGCDHGTHVAGIAAGSGSSFSGVAKEASLIAIQVFSRVNAGGLSAWSSDINRALEHVLALSGTLGGIEIAAVNMSLGGGTYSSQAACDNAWSSTKAAIDNLRAVGIATVISSGNNGAKNAISGPGCISSAISVGATTKSDQVATFSNSAPFLSLLAPGAAIRSSVMGGGFGKKSGTSMAAPHVAGAWAVMKELMPGASVDAVLEVLADNGAAISDSRNGITKPRIQFDTVPGIAPLAVATENLPAGVQDEVYTVVLEASSGTPPYTWDITSGSLPPGLSLNSTTGEISGIPTQTGTLGFTAEVTDSAGQSAAKALEIGIFAALSLLGADFDDGEFAGWTVVDEGTRGGPSNWLVSNGQLVQSSNIVTVTSEISKSGTYAMYDAGGGWTDYRVRLKIRSQDDDHIGLMFRMQDNDNYYRFSWSKQASFRWLVKKVGGTFTLLAKDGVPYVQGRTYELEITAQGSLLEVRIDGVLIFSTTDASLSGGTIALYSYGNDASWYDDVIVEEL